MLAFGCSLTYGEEIETELTIPKLFAEYVNEPLENFSIMGASNDEILFTAFENIKPGHTILVGITDVSRVYWPHSQVNRMTSLSIVKPHLETSLIGLKNSLDTWLKFCYNEHTLEQYQYKRFKHLEEYCKVLGNKIYFFSGFPFYVNLKKLKEFPYLTQHHGNNWYIKNSLIDFCEDNNFGFMPRGHPTSKAHQEYFKEMIKEYKL